MSRMSELTPADEPTQQYESHVNQKRFFTSSLKARMSIPSRIIQANRNHVYIATGALATSMLLMIVPTVVVVATRPVGVGTLDDGEPTLVYQYGSDLEMRRPPQIPLTLAALPSLNDTEQYEALGVVTFPVDGVVSSSRVRSWVWYGLDAMALHLENDVSVMISNGTLDVRGPADGVIRFVGHGNGTGDFSSPPPSPPAVIATRSRHLACTAAAPRLRAVSECTASHTTRDHA